MKGAIAALLIVIVAILGVSFGFWAGVSNSHPTTITQTPVTNNEIFLMPVNGSFYWADEVTKDIVINNPGYGYFRNGSVTFDGVKFETICPSVYQGCPGSDSSSTIVGAAGIQFSMTFPDGTTEANGEVIGNSVYVYVISQHYPKAGTLIERVIDYGYPNNPVVYAVFLLVPACCAPPYLR